MTGGLIPVDFWDKAIPPISYQEKAVKYAAISVGAMSMALAYHVGPNPINTDELYKTEYYTDALTYHAEALRLVGQAAPPNGIRIAVVSCVLFFVYAAMAEEEETARRHLIHGTMILEQFIDSQFGTSLEMLIRSPGAFEVEDEIFQVFNRLAYNFLAHRYLLQARMSLPSQIFLRQPITKHPRDIPPVFDDLNQARRWWDLLLSRTGDSARARLKLTTNPDWVKKPEVCDVNNNNIKAMEAWHRAFNPLYHRACDSQEEQFDDFVRAIHLEVQFLTHRAADAILGGCNYDTISSLTLDFGEVVRLLEIVLHLQVPSFTLYDTVLTMDMSYVLSLHLVAMNCRDDIIRGRAIDLLEKYPRRDGLWDSRAVVAIAKRNAILEEENRLHGSLEEQWDRLKYRESVIDCTHHRGTLKALRPDMTTGGWTLRTELFTW